MSTITDWANPAITDAQRIAEYDYRAMRDALTKARIALTFYREDMKRESGKAERKYPYGIDTENTIRVILGQERA